MPWIYTINDKITDFLIYSLLSFYLTPVHSWVLQNLIIFSGNLIKWALHFCNTLSNWIKWKKNRQQHRTFVKEFSNWKNEINKITVLQKTTNLCHLNHLMLVSQVISSTCVWWLTNKKFSKALEHKFRNRIYYNRNIKMIQSHHKVQRATINVQK